MIAMPHKIMLWRSDSQYRAGRFGDDLFRRRAKQRARKSAPAMRHNRDQIDIIVAHGPGDFVRRLALDNNGLDFQTVEQRINEQVFDLGPKLGQPFRILVLQDSFRKSH